MSDAAFGWLEWPVEVGWGDIMFTLIYKSDIDSGATPSLATVTGLPQTASFTQRTPVKVGKPPKYSTFQSPSAGDGNTATGWVSAVHALSFGQPPKFCVSLPGPPPTSTVSVPTFYAWCGFGVGGTLVLSFDQAFAYQNVPGIEPWCYFPTGGIGLAYGMGPPCVGSGTRESAQAFLDWQNAHCDPGAYGPGGLPSGVEEVPGTGLISHSATGGAMVATTKKDGTKIDQQSWQGYALSDTFASNAQVCFTIDSKGKIAMTVSAPGWHKGPMPAG